MPPLLAQRSGVRAALERQAVVLGPLPGPEPLPRQLALGDGGRHGAAGLAGMAAVAEATRLGELLDVAERALGGRADVVREDPAQTGRVDQDAAAGYFLS